jgi:nucleotide-binding universal stress UspA family protein
MNRDHDHDHARADGGSSPFRHVIVPVDPSGDASAATARAAHLAEQLHAELILLGVSPWAIEPNSIAPVLAGSPRDPAVAQERLDRLTQKHLDQASAGLPAGVTCRTVIGWGSLGPAIVDAAQANGADLIVLPMRTGGGLSHLLHDGADRHVLHNSPVPVLVVPAA